MNESHVKYFTPKEARKTLPLIKKIVKDIIDNGHELRKLSEQSEEYLEERIKELSSRITEHMYELEEIGCYYKDWSFSIGLVDFPSVIDNEDVMLCWRSDEEDIIYYHGTMEGYAGRKPIPEEYFA